MLAYQSTTSGQVRVGAGFLIGSGVCEAGNDGMEFISARTRAEGNARFC